VPDAPDLTELEQNLLMQLSDAEANIQAINKALVRTGYNVGLAYHQIDSNLKGNEYMNRNGGGPVRWDAFYGKTARDFVMHDVDSPVYHQLRRPSQFNFIYKANNDQVERAKEQIAGLAQDQATLLERRRKHEADQSRLWAMLSWQQVKDREIEFHPICRHDLEPQGPDAVVLRPLILFLRAANKIALEASDSISSNDQQATLETASRQMDAAFTALQLSLSDALDDSNLNPRHKNEAQNLKTLCKELSEECKVIASNYANALDRDQAKQDTSKLEFRGQLQTSLARFATMTGQLDDQVLATARAWGVGPDRGTPAANLSLSSPASGHGSPGLFDGQSTTHQTTIVARPSNPAAPGLRVVDLIPLIDIHRDTFLENWGKGARTINYAAGNFCPCRTPYQPPEEYDFRVQATYDWRPATLALIVISHGKPVECGLWNKDGQAQCRIKQWRDPDALATTSGLAWPTDPHWQVRAEVRRDSISLFLGEKLVAKVRTDVEYVGDIPPWCYTGPDNTLGLVPGWGKASFNRIEVVERSGPGKIVPLAPLGTPPDLQHPLPGEHPLRVLNLIPFADLQQAPEGKWTRQGAELIGDAAHNNGRVAFTYRPPQEYNLHMVFTREHHIGGIDAILSAFGHSFRFSAGYEWNNVCQFANVNGPNADQATSPQAFCLITRKVPYDLRIYVRKDRLAATIDGKLVIDYATDYSGLSLDNKLAIGPGLLGVGSFHNTTTFHKIELEEITGQGTPVGTPSGSGPLFSP
jgi:hypothetical protein